MRNFQLVKKTRTRIAQLAVLAALLAFCQAAFSDVRMPQIFSDGMVLQREMPVPVWGWTDVGSKVSVSFAGQTKSATADSSGKWKILLDPLTANTAGRELLVSTEGANPQKLAIRDVLVGDVWFTAGQSNMMMGLGSATGGAEALKRLEACPYLRVAGVLAQTSPPTEPLTDLSKPVAWRKPVSGYSAVSGMFAEKLYRHLGGKVPVGMITAVEIVPAESWVDSATLSAAPELQHLLKSPLGPSKCFNGIIAPLGPFALRGVLYYQGEYNGGRGAEYRSLLPALIRSWRTSFAQPDLPFLFVQLPGFQEHLSGKDARMDMDNKTLTGLHKDGERHGFVEVREAQLLTWRSVPRTGMAITIDVGDAWDIHPANKEPVADRLLLQAREVAYGEKLLASGPVPRDVQFGKNDVVVRFDYAGSGLVGRGPDGAVQGFDLAGADRRFHPAQARIDGDRVIVSCPDVPVPSMLHYAWAGFPQCTLFNREGLPATPFRWTDWTRSPMSDHAEFAFPNPSFEELDKDGKPLGWKLGPNTQLAARQAPEEKHCIEMTEAKKSGVSVIKLIDGSGSYWNCLPERPAVRPGCLVGYSVEIAALPGSGEQKCYMNLTQGVGGSATETWGGSRDISTASETFVTRSIAQRLTDQIPEYLFIYPLSPCARFIYQGGAKPGGLMFDKLSTVKILRPTLELSVTKPLDLGQAPLGSAKTTESITIRNGQRGVFRQVLSDNDPGTETATVLYGVASFAPNGWNHLQVLTKATDHVGAILIGKDAEQFEFVSDHCGPTKRQLKLVGADGRGGLLDGPAPETETFSVRFLGAEKAGDYQATLRVVTQSGNIGVLSQGGQGEPPANLYYVDIPVTVKAKR